MQQLPDLTGLKNEVIMPKSSRNVYDHAIRMVGVKIIEVDSQEELKAAINHRTAMVAVLGDRFSKNVRLPLAEVAPIANRAGIPVLVDGAADYLVVPNPYIALGADLVAYSGGKILRGPQTGGLLVGKEKLIQGAFANSAHHHAFGRPMKVSKEEIVGMTTAVDVFINQRDIQAEYKEWEGWYDYITKEITKVDGVSTKRLGPSRGGPFPTLLVEWDPKKIGLTADEMGDLLLNGEPSIASHAAGDGHSFRLRPVAMKPHEHKIVGERLHSIFRNAPRGDSKPTLKPPAADITGHWDVEVKFHLGEAGHQLFLEARGHDVRGAHVGTVVQGEVQGTIDGDRVRLRSSLPFEGANLKYLFEGRVSGDEMQGSLDLDEYPTATWTAKRHRYA
jgi:L-seryl-tRNA(Ser) seleniumtransferase